MWQGSASLCTKPGSSSRRRRLYSGVSVPVGFAWNTEVTSALDTSPEYGGELQFREVAMREPTRRRVRSKCQLVSRVWRLAGASRSEVGADDFRGFAHLPMRCGAITGIAAAVTINMITINDQEFQQRAMPAGSGLARSVRSIGRTGYLVLRSVAGDVVQVATLVPAGLGRVLADCRAESQAKRLSDRRWHKVRLRATAASA